MGLDNGITIKFTKPLKSIPLFLKNISEYDKDDSIGEYEICYWRKCWNIRREIIAALNDHNNINFKALDEIYTILTNFQSRKYWNENHDSIWEYDEIKHTLRTQRKRLKQLKNFLKRNPDLECKIYFYDSY